VRIFKHFPIPDIDIGRQQMPLTVRHDSISEAPIALTDAFADDPLKQSRRPNASPKATRSSTP
jgi:hypothetical protein